jgi:hypothetical protein
MNKKTRLIAGTGIGYWWNAAGSDLIVADETEGKM